MLRQAPSARPHDDSQQWGGPPSLLRGWRPLTADAAAIAVLVAATWLTFSSVVGHEFLLWDDDAYVTSNPMVRRGLTIEGVRWAFSATSAANWHPLTWLSHMADCQAFGSDPAASGAHHTVNLALHSANAGLLYAVLRLLGAPVWPAMLATAAFALHPLRAESLAWVAQRKDVLGMFFALLTLVAYIAYARRPAWPRYATLLAAYVLALLAKPTMVALPLLLLLLDAWPLARLQSASRGQLIVRILQEKIPLVFMAIVVAVLTVYAQNRAGAISNQVALPALIRVENAVVALAAYLRQTIWPTRLSYYYPHPAGHPAAAVVAISAFVVVALSALAAWQARRRPYLLVGWMWFLIAVIPTLGLIQVGAAARADRYTYLPHVGLVLAACWGLAELLATRRGWARSAIIAAVVVPIALFARQSAAQARVWHDTERLAQHALHLDPKNAVALATKGQALAARGEHLAAIASFRQALEQAHWLAETHALLAYSLAAMGRQHEALVQADTAIALKPRLAMAQWIRGNLLLQQNRLAEAEAALLAAVAAKDQFAAAWCDLGSVRLRQARLDDATEACHKALSIDPQMGLAAYQLALVRLAQGQATEALPLLVQAVEREPKLADARFQLGLLLADAKRPAEAAAQFEAALALRPAWPAAANELAWIYATAPPGPLRRPERALELAERASRSSVRSGVEYLDTLGAAYAATGRWDEAVTTATQAVAAAEPGTPLSAALQARLAGYRRGEAWVER